MTKKITIVLIVLSGLFFYKIGTLERFFPAQEGFIIFAGGIFWSLILYKKNKWLGVLSFLFSLGFIKTYLLIQSLSQDNFRLVLLCLAGSFIYYFVRQSNFKKEHLKYFLIPALLNVILIFIQAFDATKLPALPVEGITGFLGNKSFTGYYLAMISPIVFKYEKKWLFLLIPALFLCQSFFGIVAFICVLIIYLHNKIDNLKLTIGISLILILILCNFIFYSGKTQAYVDVAKERLCWVVGSLDGVKYKPILGWGIGTYQEVIKRIPPGDIFILGKSFNTPVAKVNHPHNEIVFGMWNLGIGFLIITFFLIRDILLRFNSRKIMSFSILVAGFVCAMGSFLTPPLWFLMMFALGIYDNQGGRNGEESS